MFKFCYDAAYLETIGFGTKAYMKSIIHNSCLFCYFFRIKEGNFRSCVWFVNDMMNLILCFIIFVYILITSTSLCANPVHLICYPSDACKVSQCKQLYKLVPLV